MFSFNCISAKLGHFYILSSKSRYKMCKKIKNFFAILENILCFIMPNFMVIAPRSIKLQPFIHLGPKYTCDLGTHINFLAMKFSVILKSICPSIMLNNGIIV